MKTRGLAKQGPVTRVMCRRCLGPHLEHECKWTLGACFSCGQTGHRAQDCKNPTLDQSSVTIVVRENI